MFFVLLGSHSAPESASYSRTFFPATKQTIKGRSPNMRHVSRTHRVDLDWLWERIREDPGIYIKDVGTKEQIADVFTKRSFLSDQWSKLCRLAQIGSADSLAKH